MRVLNKVELKLKITRQENIADQSPNNCADGIRNPGSMILEAGIATLRFHDFKFVADIDHYYES